MKLYGYYFLLIILSGICVSTKAQHFSATKGMPYVRNYSSAEYKAHEQNFSILQGDDGFIYAANFAGVLKFNGTSWAKVSSSNGMRILSLCKHKDGTVFVGGYYDFGYLQTTPVGKAVFVSLADSLAKNQRNVEIIGTHSLDNAIYFVAKNKMFIYENEQIKTIVFQAEVQSSFAVNNQLYLFFAASPTSQTQNGLVVYDRGQFLKLANKTDTRLVDVQAMFVSGMGNLIITTGSQGLFMLKGSKIVHMDAPVNAFIIDHRATCGARINKTTFALGTLNGGVALCNNQGQLLQVVDKKSKLQDESVNGLFTDNKNAIWAATNNGISKIEVNAAITYLDNENTGLQGKISDVHKFNKHMYFATDKGVFVIKQHRVEKIAGINKACFDLEVHGNKLFVASSDGVYSLSAQGEAKRLPVEHFTFCLLAAKHNKLYAGNTNKISVLQLSANNEVSDTQEITQLGGDVMNIAEAANGDIFAEIPPGKIVRYTPTTQTTTTVDTGGEFIALHLNQKQDTLFFSSEKGNYRLSNAENKLVSYRLFPSIPNEKLWLHAFYTLPNGRYVTTDGGHRNLSLYVLENGKITEKPAAFKPVADFLVNALFFDPQSAKLWLAGTNQVLIYDFAKPVQLTPQGQTKLTQITLTQTDENLPIPGQQKEPFRLAFQENSIAFDYTAAVFPSMGQVKFRYFLTGFEQDSSAWSTRARKEYINLPPGRYTFTVEAMNEYGKKQQAATFRFYIPTPFYRQWWAIVIYIAAVVFAVRYWVNWRIKLAQKEKEALEEIVRERTEEIEIQKKQVENQRDVAFHQRKEILDSINYAKRIQQAVLSSSKISSEVVFEHFILFKPRNIVSGDFYWIKKIDHYFVVVAADCTGHGVPGAFMSMLGYSFLNENVTLKNLSNPAQILTILRNKVKESMSNTDQKDGMDLAFYVINTKTKVLQYSGAYNPLFIVRDAANFNKEQEDKSIKITYPQQQEGLSQGINKIIIECKANRQPIGTHMRETDFTETQIKLLEGDTLYTFSDGYIDQFGGQTGSKFKIKNFKNLLLSIQDKTMEEQKYILERTFLKWRGDIAQVDDVLVVGLRI